MKRSMLPPISYVTESLADGWLSATSSLVLVILETVSIPFSEANERMPGPASSAKQCDSGIDLATSRR